MPDRSDVRLLLIEDEAAHAALIERNLSLIRHPQVALVHARSLAEGLARLVATPIDLILLDVNLPESRGMQTVQHLMEARAGKPVVVLTSLDDEDVAARALREGVEDYLTKSELSPELLGRTIRYALERTRHHQQQAEYAERLERSNRELEEFAQVAAHELKTPLWVINYSLGMIRDDAEAALDGDALKKLGDARDAVRQASEVIKSLLAYARVTQPAQRVEGVSIEEALRDARASLRVLIEGSGAVIEPGPLPRVFANRDQLVHVLRNLIENAIRYRGDAPPRITVSATSCNGRCEVRVADNGVGIDPRFASRMFNMFERGTDRPGGTGIGLAICKRIIERSHGRIWVDPDARPGATICFTLPTPREAAADAPARQEEVQPEGSGV